MSGSKLDKLPEIVTVAQKLPSILRTSHLLILSNFFHRIVHLPKGLTEISTRLNLPQANPNITTNEIVLWWQRKYGSEFTISYLLTDLSLKVKLEVMAEVGVKRNLRTVDCRLQTWDALQTEIKMQTADFLSLYRVISMSPTEEDITCWIGSSFIRISLNYCLIYLFNCYI